MQLPDPHVHPAAPLSASLMCFGMAGRLWQDHGLDAATLAALCGGVGTLLIGAVNASREVRAWLDRRNARCPRPTAIPACPPAPSATPTRR